MHRTFLASVAVVAGLTVVGCDRGPAVESGRADVESAEKKAAEKQAAEQRERSEEAAELERRAANLESQWTEMQTKVKTRERTATAGLREEVEEDVKNARAAVADLKTTTEENWWERHERALERSVSDVQTDVQRLTKQKTMPEPTEKAEPVGTVGRIRGAARRVREPSARAFGRDGRAARQNEGERRAGNRAAGYEGAHRQAAGGSRRAAQRLS